MITTSCLRLRSGGSPFRAGPPEDPLREENPSESVETSPSANTDLVARRPAEQSR